MDGGGGETVYLNRALLMTRVAIKRKEKKILREVSIFGLPGSHCCRILVLFEKKFTISITEPSGLFPEHSIHCFTIANSAEGCAYSSAKNQFFQYKHPFCRKLKQKIQNTDMLLSSKKDICQEPSLSFVLVHFLSSHFHHTSC